ncbi:D-alanyl-D-alanine carboxypeptidase/D-alanyl-D-alanine-endopeptidase [Rheinheimera sp.]|uniref:D-alanyl-D-alanine carboxypeptidase/D-alanyl-D-alanine endopeptidase n=1 Tax=Rheinheimera sp. TaxID=1869214 RepID=UPI00307D6588
MQLKWLSALLVVAPLYAAEPTPSATAQLPLKVSELLQQQGFPPDALAFIAYPVDNPSAAISFQPDRAMQPASTLKLLTSVAALELLGTDYRAKTELRAASPPATTPNQPLVLKGYGATELSYAEAWWLLQQAYQAGLRQMPALWLDRSWAAPARLDLAAPYFDESPEAYYNLIPDALFLERAMSLLELSSNADQFLASLQPAMTGVTIISDVRLTPQACSLWHPSHLKLQLQRQPEGFVLKLSGEFPQHCQRQWYRQLFNRADQSRLMLQQLWQQISGQANLAVLEASSPPEGTAMPDTPVLLASQQDPPLAERLRSINKNSDNALTRLLFLALAQQANGNHQAQAEQQVRHWLHSLQLNTDSLVLDNGSGLSRTERISPRLLASVLQHAWQAPYAPEFISSLPLAGVDGTLKNRFKTPGLKQQARLKTGTLRNVVALAGYLKVPGQGDWVLVAMLNHPYASYKGRPILDALVEVLMEQKSDDWQQD